jgi:hypothetical protein
MNENHDGQDGNDDIDDEYDARRIDTARICRQSGSQPQSRA